jgi:hypothetical protein
MRNSNVLAAGFGLLTLQLHVSSEVSAASVGLVSSPPERPCENTVDRDGPLSELESDATDFLDRPADQERRLVRRRGVFLSAGSASARWRMTAIMAKLLDPNCAYYIFVGN